MHLYEETRWLKQIWSLPFPMSEIYSQGSRAGTRLYNWNYNVQVSNSMDNFTTRSFWVSPLLLML